MHRRGQVCLRLIELLRPSSERIRAEALCVFVLLCDRSQRCSGDFPPSSSSSSASCSVRPSAHVAPFTEAEPGSHRRCPRNLLSDEQDALAVPKARDETGPVTFFQHLSSSTNSNSRGHNLAYLHDMHLQRPIVRFLYWNDELPKPTSHNALGKIVATLYYRDGTHVGGQGTSRRAQILARPVPVMPN